MTLVSFATHRVQLILYSRIPIRTVKLVLSTIPPCLSTLLPQRQREIAVKDEQLEFCASTSAVWRADRHHLLWLSLIVYLPNGLE